MISSLRTRLKDLIIFTMYRKVHILLFHFYVLHFQICVCERLHIHLGVYLTKDWTDTVLEPQINRGVALLHYTNYSTEVLLCFILKRTNVMMGEQHNSQIYVISMILSSLKCAQFETSPHLTWVLSSADLEMVLRFSSER